MRSEGFSLLIYPLLYGKKKFDMNLIAFILQVSRVRSIKIRLLNEVFVKNSPSKGDAEWLFQSWLTESSIFKWKDSHDVLILRSGLLNSWLITIKMLIWVCVKTWGISVTDILFMGKGSIAQFSPEMSESGSTAACCVPVRCNEECISLSAWFFLSFKGYRAPIYLQRKGQVFTEMESVCIFYLSSKMSSGLHFCTAQIALWIHACRLELFPAMNSGCRSDFPGGRGALCWEAWFSGSLMVPKHRPAIIAAEILCV